MTFPVPVERRRVPRRLFAEPQSYAVVRRILIVLVSVHVVLALWSGYRAIWQVLRLRPHVASAVMTPGSEISYYVLSSGRAPITVVVELVQGARAETLSTRRVRQNELAGYDPRIYSDSVAISVPAETLSHFAAGPAVLRFTGLGVSQFLRIPPPVIRERAVTIPN